MKDLRTEPNQQQDCKDEIDCQWNRTAWHFLIHSQMQKHFEIADLNLYSKPLSTSFSIQNRSKLQGYSQKYITGHIKNRQKIKSRYTLVLQFSSDRPSLVTICPTDAIINYAYQQKSCNCKNLPLRHEIPVSSTEACSLLCCTTAAGLEVWPYGCGTVWRSAICNWATNAQALPPSSVCLLF